MSDFMRLFLLARRYGLVVVVLCEAAFIGEVCVFKLRRRRGPVFSVRFVIYLNKRPDSVVTASAVNIFKKSLDTI